MINWLEVLKPKLLTRDETRALVNADERFYTYILWRIDKEIPEPFYVGKGHNGRILQHFCPTDRSGGIVKKRVIKKVRDHIGEDGFLFSVTFADSEESAHRMEMELIEILGRIDLGQGPLANLTNGGEGEAGRVGLRGADNPRARAISAGGIVYATVGEVANAFGISDATVIDRCKFGWPGWFYVDQGQISPQRDIKMTYRRAVVVNGIEYGSMNDASRATGIDTRLLFKWIQSGRDDCRYADEPQRPRRTNNKPVVVAGTTYPSHKTAAKSLGITVGSLRTRLESSNYPDYIDPSGGIVKRTVRKRHLNVRAEGKTYATVADATRDLGLGNGVFLFRAASSNFPDYVVDGVEKKQVESKFLGGDAPIIVNGKTFESLSAAARENGTCVASIKQRCASKAFPGYSCDDYPKKSTRDGKAGLLRVQIEGVTYRSISAAHKALGTERKTIRNRCESDKWPTWLIVKG